MSFILKGAPYPISKSPLGYLFSQEGIATLKSDLIQLLLTNPKERVMLPSYGTPLRKLLFSPNDAALVAETKRLIANSIEAWEPRIVISQIDITNGFINNSQNANELNSNDHVLTISIKFFDPQRIDYVEDLTIQLPTGGDL
jgi:phage baseplate assembly protein W